jgi:hypothetical protein
MSFAQYLSENASPSRANDISAPYDLDEGIGVLLPSPRSDLSDLMLPSPPDMNDEARCAIDDLHTWFERRKRAHQARLKLAEYQLLLHVKQLKV